jgi:hypothetical protein
VARHECRAAQSADKGVAATHSGWPPDGALTRALPLCRGGGCRFRSNSDTVQQLADEWLGADEAEGSTDADGSPNVAGPDPRGRVKF